jgi:hypothetical protein
MRNDAHTFGAETRFVVVGVLQRHLVEELREAGFHRAVVIKPERQQHRLLQPLIHVPLAVALFGDAGFAGVEQRQGLLHGATNFRGRVLGVEVSAAFERGVDDCG